MAELGSVVLLLFVWFIITILFLYTFVWVFSFPFYALWFIVKIVYFPIALINQYIYPVWPLPALILWWFTFYFLIRWILLITKSITTFKWHLH